MLHRRGRRSGQPVRVRGERHGAEPDLPGSRRAHPLAFRRMELAMRGVLRAIDLPRGRHGRRVRVAGAVITRQRPGTAKGFVFLTLEDETGIANIIVRPDLFDRERFKILDEPFLLIDGILQNQDGVTSVKAERLHALGGAAIEIDSHDFH